MIFQLYRSSGGRYFVPFASQSFLDFLDVSPGILANDATPFVKFFGEKESTELLQRLEYSAIRIEKLQHKIHFNREYTYGNKDNCIEIYATPTATKEGGVLWHGAISDLTELVNAELSAVDQYTNFGDVAKRQHEALITVNRKLVVEKIDYGQLNILRQSPIFAIGKKFISFFQDDIEKKFTKAIAKVDSGEHAFMDLSFYAAEGFQFFELLITKNYLKKSDCCYSIAIRDIGVKKEAEKRFELLVGRDAVTGLLSRDALLEKLVMQVNVANAGTTQFSVIFLDIDHFENFNLSYGIDFGNKILREIAISLKSVLSEGEILASNGGDEFVIVIKDLPDETEAYHASTHMAKSIQERFKLGFGVGNRELKMSCSMGIAFGKYESHINTPADVVVLAEIALYQAKANGGNNIYFYDKRYTEPYLPA